MTNLLKFNKIFKCSVLVLPFVSASAFAAVIAVTGPTDTFSFTFTSVLTNIGTAGVAMIGIAAAVLGIRKVISMIRS